MVVYKAKSVYKAPGVYRSGIYKDPSDVPSEDYVEIGGRKYRTTKIGEQIWLAENLDLKFTGLIIGASGTSASEARGNYYDNDEETYGVNGNKYGLLYNVPAIRAIQSDINSIAPGWHVPGRTDWRNLINALGGESIAGLHIKSTDGWNGLDGDGLTGFNAFPTGYYNGNFIQVGDVCRFLTDTDEISDLIVYDFRLNAGDNKLVENRAYYYVQGPLRLVKD